MTKIRIPLTTVIKIFALTPCLLGVVILSLYLWLLADLPPISSVEQRVVRPTSQILDRQGRLLYEVVDPEAGKQINLQLDTLPQACVQATLATEDSRFYLHPGVDPIAILRAFWQNYRAGGDIVSGGSTLTQQLARNLLMVPEERYEQSLRRKLREAWLAWRLERRYTKDELLALYLNQTYYGNFAFGMEAAAQVFFAKPASQLSRAECALLAGLVQYPSGYNPLQDPDTAKQRQLTVLRLMRESDYLTQANIDEISAEPLRYRSHLFDIEAPHFVMYIQDLIVQQLGAQRLRDGGLRVVTTLDLDLQKQAEQAIRYRLELLNCHPNTPEGKRCGVEVDPKRRVDNAAAVVLDSHTGEILAMVGNPDYFNARIQGNVNAALVLRQPGSAIKPLTYAAALDPSWNQALGLTPLTPASIIADLPTTFYVKDEKGGKVPYVPVNYDQRFHGPVSVRTALANSYNIPAVKTLNRVGVKSLQQLAAQAGISSFTREFGLALTLGGGEVKLLELAAAFGIFQNGQRLTPQAIETISDFRFLIFDSGVLNASRDPNKIQNPKSKIANQIVSPQTAYLITDILSDNVARIPAFGESSVLRLPFPAAVKTGTTTDWRDNWTIGYSTERIVGVWVGNADNTPMLDVSGIDGAGPIWHDIMLAAHLHAPPPFARPADITQVTICAPSGLLPSPHCPRTRLERFIHGTEPTQADDQFQTIAIDLTTGLAATASTPRERTAERVYWLLPSEYRDWMVAQNIPIAPTRNWGLPSGSQPNASGENPKSKIQNPKSLILTAPTSHTAYQIYPGAPRESQRIEAGGYPSDGNVWAELRLMKDGDVVLQAQNATHLNGWWTLEPGQHQFWLEGKRTAADSFTQSERAMVVVQAYQRNPVP